MAISPSIITTIIRAMVKKSFLLKCRSKCKNLAVIAEKSPTADECCNRTSSGSTIDECQIALFYSDQEKVKVMPIPTAPPSPPKRKENAVTKVPDAAPQDCSSPLKCGLPTTATQLLLSPPLSPVSSGGKESTLDRGIRLTVVERQVPSPAAAGSSVASNPAGECRCMQGGSLERREGGREGSKLDW